MSPGDCPLAGDNRGTASASLSSTLSESLAPLALACPCCALTRWLEHGPLDRRYALLEAGWAGPREVRRGCKLTRELGLAQALIRVVVDGRTKAACEQLAAALTGLALAI